MVGLVRIVFHTAAAGAVRILLEALFSLQLLRSQLLNRSQRDASYYLKGIENEIEEGIKNEIEKEGEEMR